MLKKIITIFLSLTFLVYSVMLQGVLQKPRTVEASSAIQTGAISAGDYIMVPYSVSSDNTSGEAFIVGGKYQVKEVINDGYFAFHYITVTKIYSGNWDVHSSSSAQCLVPTTLYYTAGTGTSNDPYVVLGL